MCPITDFEPDPATGTRDHVSPQLARLRRKRKRAQRLGLTIVITFAAFVVVALVMNIRFVINHFFTPSNAERPIIIRPIP